MASPDLFPQDGPRELVAPAPTNPVQEVSATYTQNARGRITALPVASSLILLGILLLAQNTLEGFQITWPVAGLIVLAGLVLTYLLRFFISGRRERGTFFLALAMLSFGAVLALLTFASQTFPALEWWPLTIIGLGVAALLTWALERDHERGLLGLALLLGLAGVVGLAVTLEAVPQSVLDSAQDFFPLILAFIGITLIPLALRRSSE